MEVNKQRKAARQVIPVPRKAAAAAAEEERELAEVEVKTQRLNPNVD